MTVTKTITRSIAVTVAHEFCVLLSLLAVFTAFCASFWSSAASLDEVQGPLLRKGCLGGFSSRFYFQLGTWSYSGCGSVGCCLCFGMIDELRDPGL